MEKEQSKTRQAIIDAFVRLLTKRSYEKISVKDIISEADVARSTFYVHFETKDDLAHKMCLTLFRHIFSDTMSPCSIHNFSRQPQNAQTRITHILYHLRYKRQYYLGIINYDEGNLFLRFFREYIQDNLRIVITGPNRFHLVQVPDDFLVSHIASSFIGMVRWWLKNDMRQTPEQAAAYYIALLNPAIAEFKTRSKKPAEA